jgi:5-methylcytosine-specific restriction enzyme A
MPSKPPRACPRPRCPHRQPCPLHDVQRWRRVTPQCYRSAPGLPSDWPKIRAAVLAERPWCEWIVKNQHVRSGLSGFFATMPCGAPAQIVDHILPKSQGGTDDPANLQPLCLTHSRSKTGREGGRAR